MLVLIDLIFKYYAQSMIWGLLMWCDWAHCNFKADLTDKHKQARLGWNAVEAFSSKVYKVSLGYSHLSYLSVLFMVPSFIQGLWLVTHIRCALQGNFKYENT